MHIKASVSLVIVNKESSLRKQSLCLLRSQPRNSCGLGKLKSGENRDPK